MKATGSVYAALDKSTLEVTRDLRMLKVVLLSIGLLSIGGCLAPPASCQLSPDFSSGMDAAGTYHGTDIDSVDMRTGRLQLHIPLLTDHSQRGALNFSYSVVFSGGGNWTPYCDPQGDPCYWIAPDTFTLGPAPIMDQGLGYPGFHYEPCGLLFDSSGGEHVFSTPNPGSHYPCGGSSSTYPTLESVDGTGIQYSGWLANAPVVTNNRGIQFNYSANSWSTTTPNFWVEDPNGNEMTITGSGAELDFGTMKVPPF
jgi:hypothetical protein